jgi:hypothetical protein
MLIYNKLVISKNKYTFLFVLIFIYFFLDDKTFFDKTYSLIIIHFCFLFFEKKKTFKTNIICFFNRKYIIINNQVFAQDEQILVKEGLQTK